MSMWLVMCRRSGGIAPDATGPLMENGKVLTFHSEKDALAAKPQNRGPTGSSTAYLDYWVERFRQWPRCECGCLAEDHNKELDGGKNHACDICPCKGYHPNQEFIHAVRHGYAVR